MTASPDEPASDGGEGLFLGSVFLTVVIVTAPVVA
jgi:hypothetical protein